MMSNRYRIENQDKTILQRLASEIAEYVVMPQNDERKLLWAKLNQLESSRPMVFINEIPWHEMNINDELTLCTKGCWAQELEAELRRTIYQWKHMQVDMVVSNYIECPIEIHNTGLGIEEECDISKTDLQNDVVSRHFHRQICEPDDIEKIKMPVVTIDYVATETKYNELLRVFGSILPVKKAGIRHLWFTPWDNLIRWWGVQEAMMDMIERPEMVHAAVERFVEAHISMLDQFEKLNLLSENNLNIRIGSGGYGYTNQLPGSDFDPCHVRPINMWGCSNAQIFSNISPEMHWEFAIKHDMKWLAKWGQTYYGCCEPLDIKIDLMKRIPNLRKISMSPWINVERASNLLSNKYVFSYKPNPAIFAQGSWDPQNVRYEIKSFLAKTRDCQVEIIMKDISTVQHQPRRLWDWAEIVMQEINNL